MAMARPGRAYMIPQQAPTPAPQVVYVAPKQSHAFNGAKGVFVAMLAGMGALFVLLVLRAVARKAFGSDDGAAGIVPEGDFDQDAEQAPLAGRIGSYQPSSLGPAGYASSPSAGGRGGGGAAAYSSSYTREEDMVVVGTEYSQSVGQEYGETYI